MRKILNLTLLATTLLLFGCASSRYLVTNSNFRNKAKVTIKNVEYVTGKCTQGHANAFPPAGEKFCSYDYGKGGLHYAAISPVDAINVEVQISSEDSVHKKDELFYLTAAEACSQLGYKYLVKTVEDEHSSFSQYTSFDQTGSVINGQYYGSVTRNVHHISMYLNTQEFIFFNDPNILSVGLFRREKVPHFSNSIRPCVELYDRDGKYEIEQKPGVNGGEMYIKHIVKKEAWKNYYFAKDLASELRTELKLSGSSVSYEIKSDIEEQIQWNKNKEQSALERLKQD